MSRDLVLHQPQFSPHPRPRALRSGLLGGLLLLSLAQPSHAAHWQMIGPTSGSSSGVVYIDLDSVREEVGYRVAVFLTIYSSPVPNAHDIKLDRITQETAFDCERREFALRSTVGYLRGKEVGLSSDKGEGWKQRLKAVPKDVFSQRVLDLACNSPLAPQPEATSAADAPGSVRLPGPDGVVSGEPTSRGREPPPSDP